ncbi:citrate synthase [Terrarubrum flagellatum]|uniref:citrate synthase n=1 Tax=Terrirubrum flagellatum TaxID=2895980 RepID=UPI00314559B2
MAWLTAEEALAELGTRAQTLYANVSRGRIRAKPDPADARRSLYSAADVDRMAARRSGRRRTEAMAAETIRWGDPILPSAISTVHRGRLFYRGRDAAALAETATLEEAAALLWGARAVEFSEAQSVAPLPGGTALQNLFGALARWAGEALPTSGRSAAALRGDAAEIVAALAAAAVGGRKFETTMPLHQRIAAAWRRPAAADVIRRALVLLADHELNASTFAARVAASTGASLEACALAGFATLTGPRHGGAPAAAQALAASAMRVGADSALREWLARGHAVPAFGHQLYPDGDIRAAALMSAFELAPAFIGLRDAGMRVTGEQPNVDFALAAMTASFELPEDAPIIVFALARSVGWMGHALEQIASGGLIRPRARYVGPAVASFS